jgi:hypothetical protein
VLPNLIVIGAPKCGTTSLHFYLDQHPDISMSTPKELRFFWQADWQSKVTSYERHFESSPQAQVRGESTPGYTLYPYRRDVPDRMHSLVPRAKLIYVVRDPIHRILSHWAETVSNSRYRTNPPPVPRKTLSDWIRNPEDRDNVVVWASRYATQLEQYLRVFPSSQILVLDFDDLRDKRRDTLQECFEFLSLDGEIAEANLLPELNTRSDQRELTAIGAPIWNYLLWPMGRRAPRALRQPLARLVKSAVHRKVDPAELNSEERAKLSELLAPEVKRLRAFTGKAFAKWSI